MPVARRDRGRRLRSLRRHDTSRGQSPLPMRPDRGPSAALTRPPRLPATSVPTGLAARAEIRDAGGAITGYAYAVQPISEAFLAELSGRCWSQGSAHAWPAIWARTRANHFRWTFAAPPVVGPAEPWPLLLLAAAVALLASALLGWWISGVATRPLRRLLATVDRVGAGDLTARSLVSGRDEAGRLGWRLNEMITAMQETQRLSVTDALTGLGNVRHLVE